MSRIRTHYDNLKVARDASDADIRVAYQALIRKYHPDQYDGDPAEALRIARFIQASYAVLSDPGKRREHDEWIRLREEGENDEAGSNPFAERPPDQEQEYSQNTAKNIPPNPRRHGARRQDEDGADSEAARVAKKDYHPWRRFLARLVDGFTLVVPLSAALVWALGRYWPGPEFISFNIEKVILALLAGLLAYIPVEAWFLCQFGATPGKWLFGIRVRYRNGAPLELDDAFKRSFRVWAQGLFMGLPILSLLTLFLAYFRLQKTGGTAWDNAVKSVVTHAEWSPLRTFSCVVAFLALAFAMVMLHGVYRQFYAIQTSADCPDCPEMVRLPIGIAMGKYEVTQEQWRAVMGANPSGFSGCDRCPVETVSWNDVQEFIQRLNAKTGQQYRLPRENEWFDACQADGSHEFCGSGGIDALAWHAGNALKRPHTVGQKRPNAWGLYDMSGNVWEWTQDCWDADCSRRTRMGGSWLDTPTSMRATNRGGFDPIYRASGLGFRLVQTQLQTQP